VIGEATYDQLSSESSTTNGVGSAYGDGSYINMNPYQSPVNDPNTLKEKQTPLSSHPHIKTERKTSSLYHPRYF